MIIVNSNKIVMTMAAGYGQMYAHLAYVYYIANFNNIDLDVTFIWLTNTGTAGHDVDNNFMLSFEDEESQIEIFNYVHSLFQYKPNNLKISHRLTNDVEYYAEIKNNDRQVSKEVVKFKYPDEKPSVYLAWPLRNKFKPVKNKVTLWRPTFTHSMMDAASHKTWHDETHPYKNNYTYDEWNYIIDCLKKYFSVYEIQYRNPIREIIYHISTSEFCFGYCGLAHGLSIGLNVPEISVSNKKDIHEFYGHRLNFPDLKLFESKEYIDEQVKLAKQKIAPMKDWYESFFL